MPATTRRRTATTIDFEFLEPRQLLASFGTPWPEPRSLTISFPADGVEVGNHTNDIRQTLDEIAQRQQWEELAVRAFQTWAIHADINVGLRNDYDLDFGTPGLSVNDPRFGEFRIGAFPQIGLMANSLPFQVVAGTYSGDLLLNSNEQFRYHDWSDDAAPDPSTLGANDRDLFSVLLHETGNTLGVDDSLDPWTVMFRQYTVPKGVLAAEDIAGIQAIYGARTDPYETLGNDELQVATLVPSPVGFDPDNDFIRTPGSLVTANDVDHYEIRPVAGRDSVTIRLKAAGISLLQSRLEVLDEFGQVRGRVDAESVFANDNTLQINGLQSDSTLYVRVSPVDASGLYSVGDYELQIDYRSATAQAADPVAGSYDSGVDSIFTNYALVDAELGANDSTADADSISEFQPAARFETQSSVSSVEDIDYLKVTAPSNASDRLVFTVAGVGGEQPELRVRVLDASGQNVGAAGRLRSDGTWALEVAQPQAGEEYFLRVSVDPNSTVGVGNYVVTAEFTAPSDQMNELVAGELSSEFDEFFRWTAGKTKLFRFDLNASGATTDDLVKLTIYDAHTGEMRLVIATPSGMTRTALAWLPQGEYILRFTAYSHSGSQVPSIGFTLTCDGISDDQDEDDVDPDDTDSYEYYYDNDVDVYDYYDYDNSYDYDYDYSYDYNYEYP